MKGGMAFIGIGFELVGVVLASLYIGTVLDAHFQGLRGMGVPGAVLLGSIGWFVHLFYLVAAVQKNDDEREQK
jgi:hypothetical protein